MKFLRRASHLVSIVTLLLATATCALAQSTPQPAPISADETRTNHQAVQKSLDSIATQLSAIRADATRREQDEKADQSPYWADKLPEFLTLLVAAGGVWAALRTLAQLRRQNELVRRTIVASIANARAAQETAKTAQKAFFSDQRPWVTLNLSIESPLSYDAAGWDAGTRWHIIIGYDIRNIGQSPALSTKVSISIVPWIIGPTVAADGSPIDDKATNVEALVKQLTVFESDIDRTMLRFGARILFRDEQAKGRYHVNLNPALIDAAMESPYYSGQFMLVAAVTYKTDLSEQILSTAKAFHLFKKTGSQQIQLSGETIAVADLGLVSYPVHVDQAT